MSALLTLCISYIYGSIQSQTYIYSAQGNAEENILTPSGEIIASQRVEGPYYGDYLFYNYDTHGSTTNLISHDDGLSAQNYVYDEFYTVSRQGTTNNEVQYTSSG